MSDPTTPATGTNWQSITSEVVSVVSALASLAVPGAGPAISLGTKIVQGVIAEAPAAIALFEQIKSGKTPTPAELKSFADAYEADYQALHADIQQRLAQMPAAPGS